MSLNLDKRIRSMQNIETVFSGCKDWLFMGKMGYFADNLEEFRDLTKCVYGEYMGYAEKDQCFTAEVRGNATQFVFRYFIPEDVLIPEEPEKKYRPYTLAEWIGQHTIGDVIRYRCKSQKIELRHLYAGYAYSIGTDIKNTTSGTLTLGVASYTMNCLLEDYEIEVNGEWLPFGVIDEEGVGE